MRNSQLFHEMIGSKSYTKDMEDQQIQRSKATFSSGQHQTLMNSTAMQDLHNSAGMQNAMQTGDVKAMQDLMNSDPNVKAQMGQDNLDKMNQFMSNSGGNMMTNGSGTANTGSNMMNF